MYISFIFVYTNKFDQPDVWKKLDSLLTWKIPTPHPPPFSLIKWLVYDKENNSLREEISLHSGTLMTDS
jgi:hypothetical protein